MKKETENAALAEYEVDYEALDKDYGRAWAVGPGYGEIDPVKYAEFLLALENKVEA